MRIGIDGKLLSTDTGGIGRYATQLVHALLERGAGRSPAVEFVLFSGPQTDDRVLEAMPGDFVECRVPVKSSVFRAWAALPAALRRQRIDVFHGLDHVGAPLGSAAARCVVTLHDIFPISHPEWYPWRHRTVVRWMLPRALRRADRVIVPSEFVRRCVLERGLVEESRLKVIPEGCEQRFHPRRDSSRMPEVIRKYALPSRYALCVGTGEPRKNLATLLRAFERLDDTGLDLVVAGTVEPTRSSSLPRVRMLGVVDDEDLPELYRGAQLFVHPAFAEGFGLTVLEAMASGTPVVASHGGAIPEVAGDAAILFDPSSAEEMAAAIRRVLEDDGLAGRMAEKGPARASRFSWTAAAEATFQTYEEALA